MIKLGKDAPELAGIAAPPMADTFATLDQPRDGKKVDGRTLRATGRTTQFSNRITAEAVAAFEGAAEKAGLKKNELLEAMIAFWIAHKDGVPEMERAQGRNIPVTIYGTDEFQPGLQILAERRGASLHAVLEELVAVRITQLRDAGQLPNVKLKAKA